MDYWLFGLHCISTIPNLTDKNSAQNFVQAGSVFVIRVMHGRATHEQWHVYYCYLVLGAYTTLTDSDGIKPRTGLSVRVT